MFITYEHPLNEQTRICLRLEHNFKQLVHGLKDSSEWGSCQAVSALLSILSIIDRPDLKTKLTQTLLQYAASLSQLKHKPGVDDNRLQEILERIEHLADGLYATRGKVGDQLKTNDFLNTVRAHLASPGGACPFNTPAYYLWLHRPSVQRLADIEEWLAAFGPLQDIVNLLLELTRQSAVAEFKVAKSGFYHQSFDPSLPYQLVCVTVELDRGLYPEISAGRHGLSIRWFKLDRHAAEGKSVQTQADVGFDLVCCKLGK